MKIQDKRLHRERRHRRVRAKIQGTAERPRLSIFRSSRGLRAQLIDDAAGHTLVSAGTSEIEETKKAGHTAMAEKLGGLIAKRAVQKAISRAVFDRGPYKYHGLVRAIAEGARKAGLKI